MYTIYGTYATAAAAQREKNCKVKILCIKCYAEHTPPHTWNE